MHDTSPIVLSFFTDTIIVKTNATTPNRAPIPCVIALTISSPSMSLHVMRIINE